MSLHNGGGVGWGEAINGGFGLVLDGSQQSSENIDSMISWDVNNGLARRSWARNDAATFAIARAMKTDLRLEVPLPELVDGGILDQLFTTSR